MHILRFLFLFNLQKSLRSTHLPCRLDVAQFHKPSDTTGQPFGPPWCYCDIVSCCIRNYSNDLLRSIDSVTNYHCSIIPAWPKTSHELSWGRCLLSYGKIQVAFDIGTLVIQKIENFNLSIVWKISQSIIDSI
jgi:hypothetical protein